MHLLMAANALAAYPNHNKWFGVYTYAYDFQLGACFIQEGRLVAYFSCKLKKSQQKHTIMEKEMLSVVAFSPMLHYIEGPCNILADNLSRLHCIVTPAQIAEGKKLIEPTEVSNEEEDKAYLLDQEYSGLYDNNVWECIECYLNLPDTPHPDENPLNYAHICELQQ